MEKGHFVSDITTPGITIEGIFFVEQKRLLDTKNGLPYLALTLSDRSGRIEGRVWENAAGFADLFEVGDAVFVKGEVQLFRESLQVKLSGLKKVEVPDPSFFLPVTSADPDALWSELQRFTKGVKDPVLSGLLGFIFRDRRIATAFRAAPAAKRMHHAYIGGLLEHSVSVARNAVQVSRLYSQIDRDLLVTGAILHDIGKIDELRYDAPPIDYTDKGRLLGHIAIGLTIVDGFCPLLEDTAGADERISALKHLILSHHGQREFGSPVLPMTEEALVLHLIDDLDAKLNFLDGLKKTLPAGRRSWTDFQRTLDRHLFLPGLRLSGEGADEETGVDKGETPPQPGLWD